MKQIAAFPMALALLGADAPAASLDIDLNGLRNNRGAIHACLTRDKKHFPDCSSDPAARKQTVPASVRRIHLADVPAGSYAVAVIHDENGNGKIDKTLGIPREGFGFSRDPAIRFGPPRWKETVVALPAGPTRIGVKMRYLL